MDVVPIEVQRADRNAAALRRLCALAWLVLTARSAQAAAPSAAADAAPVAACATLHLQASLSDDGRTISGTLHCTTAAAGELMAFAYPNLLTRPDALDDLEQLWFYPDGFDAAGMQLRLDTPAAPPLPGSADGWHHLGVYPKGADVTVHFVTKVPNRRGAFGLRYRVAYLLAGWYPQLGHRLRGAAGADTERLSYAVQMAPGRVGFVGQQPFGAQAPRCVTGDFSGGLLPWLVAPGAHVTRLGDTVLVAPEDGYGHAPDGGDVTDWRTPWVHQEIARTLQIGSQYAAGLGLTQQPQVAVIAPLRDTLAEPFAGGLAISDRTMQVVDVKWVKLLHRAAIWRAQLAAAARWRLLGREPRIPTFVVAELVGAALTDQLLQLQGDGMALAQRLEMVAVIPEIDDLIFAPQAPFNGSYYGPLAERRRASERPEAQGFAWSGGNLAYSKLADWVGRTQAQQQTLAYLVGQTDWLGSVATAFGNKLAAAMPAWLGSYPQLDYALEIARSTPNCTELQLRAHGRDAAAVLEPLSVQVVDARGEKHRAQRLGPGPLKLAAPGPVRSAELDPDGRLLQLAHAPGFGPRYNDRQPTRLRLLLNDVGGVVAATGMQISVFGDLSLRRLHDLRASGLFGVSLTPYSFGASATARYHFGALVTPLRLAQAIDLGLTYAYLRPGYGAPEPGNQVGLALSYGWDTRLSRFVAYRGHAATLQAAGGLTMMRHSTPQPYGTVGVAALNIWPWAYGHALLTRVRADAAFGDVPAQSQLRLGGRYLGMRGFESDEQTARRRVLASAEYRHVLWGDGRTNLFGALALTHLDGALFADAAYLHQLTPACGRSMFYDVGYGVRFLAEAFNISPASFQVDIGFPLGRCPSGTGRLPFSIWVAFVQSFSTF
jgi:hypothetical protein